MEYRVQPGARDASSSPIASIPLSACVRREAMRKALWAALAANVLWASACSDDKGTDPGPRQVDPVGPLSPAAPLEREIRGGRVHDVVVSGLTDNAHSDPSKLVDAVESDLRGRLGAIKPTDFIEAHRDVQPAKGGARLSFITLKQTIGGVPIEGTYLHVGVRNANGSAKLVSSSYRLYENVQVDPKPGVAKDRALVLAQKGLRLRSAIPASGSGGDLVVHKLDGRLQLAWSFAFPGSYKRAYVIASGAEKGRVYAIDQRVYD